MADIYAIPKSILFDDPEDVSEFLHYMREYCRDVVAESNAITVTYLPPDDCYVISFNDLSVQLLQVINEYEHKHGFATEFVLEE